MARSWLRAMRLSLLPEGMRYDQVIPPAHLGPEGQVIGIGIAVIENRLPRPRSSAGVELGRPVYQPNGRLPGEPRDHLDATSDMLALLGLGWARNHPAPAMGDDVGPAAAIASATWGLRSSARPTA